MLDKVRTSTCHHCLATMPEAAALQMSIAGTPRAFCCHGCASAAQLIEALSLQSYYDYRNTCGTAAPSQAAQTTLGSSDYLPALASSPDGTQTLRL